jgi:uncharacterized membrane protein
MTKRRPTPASHDEPENSDELGLERIVFFSDAVFAIAVTLLALEIRLPAGTPDLSDALLLVQLGGMWHKYLGYFISFMVIGIFWMAHHRKFHYIKRYDSRLMMLNLLMLMVVAFIPFPTALISEYSGSAPTILYAATMIMVNILFVFIWWYASWHNHLTDPNLNPQVRRRQFISPIATALIFLVSIGVALVYPDVAKLIWTLILPVTMFAMRQR